MYAVHSFCTTLQVSEVFTSCPGSLCGGKHTSLPSLRHPRTVSRQIFRQTVEIFDTEKFGDLPEIFERRAQIPRLTGATGIVVATELPKNPGAGLVVRPGAGLAQAPRLKTQSRPRFPDCVAGRHVLANASLHLQSGRLCEQLLSKTPLVRNLCFPGSNEPFILLKMRQCFFDFTKAGL